MPTMIVKMRVASFERWKQNFESMRPVRERHGWLSHRVVRDATDPNVVTVISRVRALESAKQYGQSADLRDAMRRSGVQGAPDVSFCEDESDGTYDPASDVQTSVMKLHYFPSSTSSRPVLLFCAEAKIPFEPCIVDLRRGAQFEEPFASLNPNHLVPVLEDGDFVLSESSAILKYLADKYASPAYPRDAKQRARVNERMDWISANFMREWTYSLIYPQIFPHYRRTPDLAQSSLLSWGKAKAERWLEVLDRHLLGSSSFLCGSEMTIADYFAAEVLWSGSIIGASFARYANVERWMGSMQALPSWPKVNEAVDALAAGLRGKDFVTIA